MPRPPGRDAAPPCWGRPAGNATLSTAWKGIDAFSVNDEKEGVYRLAITRVGDKPGILPVAARPVAFDADLGPDTRNEPAIVCSRCDSEAPERRACDIFRYTRTLTAPRTRRSQRLPGLPSRRCSDQICGLSGQSYVGLSFDEGRLYWARYCARDPSGCNTTNRSAATPAPSISAPGGRRARRHGPSPATPRASRSASPHAGSAAPESAGRTRRSCPARTSSAAAVSDG